MTKTLQQVLADESLTDISCDSVAVGATAGWFFQGTSDWAKCPHAHTNLLIFRNFQLAKPEILTGWAIVCKTCSKLFGLAELTPQDQSVLATWATAAGDLQRFTAAKGNASKNVSLTDEQAVAVRLAAPVDGSDGARRIKIEALAGSGKTTTLIEIAKRKGLAGNQIGQYVAFNNKIVREVRDKLSSDSNLKANTIHSLAHRAIGRIYGERIQEVKRLTFKGYADFLQCDRWEFTDLSGVRYRFIRSDVARLAKLVVDEFTRSAADEIGPDHVAPFLSYRLDTEDAREQLVQLVIPLAKKIWADLQDPDGVLPFSHNDYLKIWHLNNPKIDADYILLDEAQDLNPVMVDIVLKQKDAQVIMCGDGFQQIYQWNGAVNALADFDADVDIRLSQSFRFGDAIAAEANEVLKRLTAADSVVPPLSVAGSPSIASTVGAADEEDAILCRTNAGAIDMLMSLYEGPRTVALQADREELIKIFRGLRTLRESGRSRLAELRDFRDWQHLTEWVSDHSEAAGELGVLVKLAIRHSPGRLMYAMLQAVDPERADIVISTVHKAKGLEWKRVRIHSDFPHIDDMDQEELRVLYVALTRAQHNLDVQAWRSRPSAAEQNKEVKQRLFRGPIPRLVDSASDESDSEDDDVIGE